MSWSVPAQKFWVHLQSGKIRDWSRFGCVGRISPNCTVVGVPGRIVKRDDKKVLRSEMDQIHLPDPALSDIRSLQKESRELHSQLTEMVTEDALYETVRNRTDRRGERT